MSEVPLYALDSGVSGGYLFWGYNPLCKVTPVILHGVVSHDARGCIPRPVDVVDGLDQVVGLIDIVAYRKGL